MDKSNGFGYYLANNDNNNNNNSNNNNNGNFIKICYIDISTIINLTTKVIYNCLLEPDKKL